MSFSSQIIVRGGRITILSLIIIMLLLFTSSHHKQSISVFLGTMNLKVVRENIKYTLKSTQLEPKKDPNELKSNLLTSPDTDNK